MRYIVLSPDGFAIHPVDTYPSKADALLAAIEWAKTFEFQGYYSTFRWERIPLDELVGRCRIEEYEEDEDDEDSI